jgi:hypothetical protein
LGCVTDWQQETRGLFLFRLNFHSVWNVSNNIRLSAIRQLGFRSDFAQVAFFMDSTTMLIRLRGLQLHRLATEMAHRKLIDQGVSWFSIPATSTFYGTTTFTGDTAVILANRYTARSSERNRG